jgi:chemotaxis protein CheZ
MKAPEYLMNPMLNRIAYKDVVRGMGRSMAVQRKRFRIEEFSSEIEGSPMFDESDGSVVPFHHEIMKELRAIRAEMATPHVAAAADDIQSVTPQQSDDAKALLETYRAQIAQCEKLKTELDLIHEAINRTKREIATLHGKSFDGDEMAKVTGELGAVVGGTEQATEQILEAAEAIDQAAAALAKVTSPDQQAQLREEIQERVVGIFEACNFQDLTGQRISKVMGTMKFIEHHINVMMDIWGGVDEIKQHAPAVHHTRTADEKLLNGPKAANDEGHASQDDIDALFN